MPVYRSSTCPSCGADVKVCLNCRFFEPEAHWDCRETINEMVAEKGRANFCDFFVLSQQKRDVRDKTPETKARTDFDKLFGND